MRPLARPMATEEPVAPPTPRRSPGTSARGTSRLTKPSRAASTAGEAVTEEEQLLGLVRSDEPGEEVGAGAVRHQAPAHEQLMNRVSSATTTRSQAKARWAPMPATVPLTAAITGLSQSSTETIKRWTPWLINRTTSPTGQGGRWRVEGVGVAKVAAGAEVPVTDSGDDHGSHQRIS